MGDYGYLHTARVVGLDTASGGWFVESVALARDRRWGPIPSCVLGLQPGDKVVLAATGTTRDNLLILGPLDPHYPDIGDIPGLTAALALKADQTALDAAVANITTEHNTNVAQNTRLDGIDALDITQNGRLTAVEGVNTTQDGRLTTAEGTIVSNTGILSGHTSQLSALETWSRIPENHDQDVYGDVQSPFARIWTSNVRTMVNQAAYFWRTRMRAPLTLTTIRVIVTTVGAGVGGLTTASLFKSTSASNGPFSPIGSATNALTSLGVQSFTFTGAPVVAGDWLLLVLLLNNSYTTVPRIAALQSAAQSAASLQSGGANVVWGTKVGVTSMPATITTNDGTWTAEASPWWIAAA